ncbi:MAG TPA: 2-oxoglutarate dehydrogenase complex dihydrolipoyllysine-residue succinyltransferase [Thermomicrobiales bacterium]|jgi:2-oxoglutarate dehydrogenase E2 component (dihydrolipoamide succinyltransferase)|nr:2-oxoglutarate dehydrogenase complex dihydrolipoyllysine-residue succinyltransferase [Thermomicrobiales bacterium]
MAVEIRVPPLGESLVDAVVGTWLKGEGDEVSRGETIVELETDKVNLEVTATEDGVLQSIARQEGDVVTVDEVLALLGGASGGDTAAAAGASSPAVAEPAGGPASDQQTAAADSGTNDAPIAAAAPPAKASDDPARAPAPAAAPAASSDGDAGRAAPMVRRLAEEHNVDLSTVTGSGPGGRITREDVLVAARAGSQPAPAPAAAPPAAAPAPATAQAPAAAAPTGPTPAANGRPEEIVRFSRRRQTIANRLVEAQQTAAMLTTFNEIDMTAVMDVRKRRKDAFKEKNGVNLGFMSFFTKAVIGALRAFPNVNAELRGDQLVLKRYYDIGIAVGVEEGLVVPVIRDADRMSFAGIEREIGELAGRARAGKLTLDELSGGTFTITNGGVFGSLLSTPILNMPQVGILGMHTIQQRPVAVNGEVVIRPMMYIALSYDHRVVDGREAVQFLVKVKELLEDPENLLLEG